MEVNGAKYTIYSFPDVSVRKTETKQPTESKMKDALYASGKTPFADLQKLV
jgi:hypothetical protein